MFDVEYEVVVDVAVDVVVGGVVIGVGVDCIRVKLESGKMNGFRFDPNEIDFEYKFSFRVGWSSVDVTWFTCVTWLTCITWLSGGKLVSNLCGSIYQLLCATAVEAVEGGVGAVEYCCWLLLCVCCSGIGAGWTCDRTEIEFGFIPFRIRWITSSIFLFSSWSIFSI